jgi:hypothetical protein
VATEDRRNRRPPLLLLPAALVCVAALVAAACDEQEPAGPAHVDSRLLDALESVGGADGAPGTGYGWVDVTALRERAATSLELARELAWAGRALGPGGDDLLGDRRASAALGVDPADAEQVLSASGSFTFGVRLDGVDGERGRSALEGATGGGAETPAGGGWTEMNLAREGSQPRGPGLDSIGSLAGRVAVAPDSLILARSDEARRELEGVGPPVAQAPVMHAAAECLGDVDVAQTVPNNFAGAPNVGPEIYAMGVRDEQAEVLCVLDADAADMDHAEDELRATLAPGARDELTGRPIADEVASAEVERYESQGQHVLRATLTRGPEAKPGFLFGAFVRGSLPTWAGASPPPVADPSVFED